MEEKENVKDMEMDIDQITIRMEDGTDKEADVLLHFSFEEGELEKSDTEKEYVIYTFNEIDDAGYIVLYASIVNREEDGSISLLDIEKEEVWSKVKELMRELIKKGEEEA